MMYILCFLLGSLVTWALLASHEDHAAMHREPVSLDHARELALIDVAAEMMRARAKFPPMRSAHEGHSIIEEEFDELWAEVRVRQDHRDLDKMRAEAIQVAAMAVCFAAEVCGEETGRV